MLAYLDQVGRYRHGSSVRPLDDAERERVDAAFERYLQTIPPGRRYDRELFYEVSDVAGVSAFGIGSAGLPAYNVLVEGFSEALDDDVILSMKQANVPAVSLVAARQAAAEYFEHEGHRTVVSQRALQLHSDHLLGWTDVDGVGFVVSEISPYELDLDWDSVDEPGDMELVVETLGRATAKVHCASDADSDQDLVDFQTERAVLDSVHGREDEFTRSIVDFGVEYAAQVRADHAHFVDAFREGDIGVAAT